MRFISIIVLILNGMSACFGGIALIADPTGKLIQLPETWLEYTPFRNFLIPGIILFVVLGIGSLFSVIQMLRKDTKYPVYLVFEGTATITWIFVQIILSRQYFFLQPAIGAIGLILLLSGMLHWKNMKVTVN